MIVVNFLRSVLHLLVMVVTVIPWALAVIAASPFVSSTTLYWMCANWLRVAVHSGTLILGIRNRVTGWENLPVGSTAPAVLLLKHQSTWETFAMPTLMPHPLAYVFKKELLYVPFFGWAMGRLDMIHIDRSKRTQAFNKVVEQGQRLLDQGTWVIMFPEGTRIPRGEKGSYKTGGTRLAVATGAPCGRLLHRQAHSQPGPRGRRTHARGRGLDRGRDAPARSGRLSLSSP
jgi:1-acyl-sn-glycerol-3-phosphate acyltransferase